MTRQKCFFLLGALVSGVAAFAMSDDALRRNLLFGFWADTQIDCLVDGRTPFDGLTFEQRYGARIRSTGWGRERFFRELDALVSNGCSRVGEATNFSYGVTIEPSPVDAEIDSSTMEVAVECLCGAESNEWIPCAGWLLTNGVDDCAIAIGELYVKKYGFGVMSGISATAGLRYIIMNMSTIAIMITMPAMLF